MNKFEFLAAMDSRWDSDRQAAIQSKWFNDKWMRKVLEGQYRPYVSADAIKSDKFTDKWMKEVLSSKGWCPEYVILQVMDSDKFTDKWFDWALANSSEWIIGNALKRLR